MFESLGKPGSNLSLKIPDAQNLNFSGLPRKTLL